MTHPVRRPPADAVLVLAEWVEVFEITRDTVPHRLVVLPDGELHVEYRTEIGAWWPCANAERHLAWMPQ